MDKKIPLSAQYIDVDTLAFSSGLFEEEEESEKERICMGKGVVADETGTEGRGAERAFGGARVGKGDVTGGEVEEGSGEGGRLTEGVQSSVGTMEGETRSGGELTRIGSVDESGRAEALRFELFSLSSVWLISFTKMSSSAAVRLMR